MSGELGDCPWYLGTGTCSYGCYDEPSCETCEPEGGWLNGPVLPRPGTPRAEELMTAMVKAMRDKGNVPESELWDAARVGYEALRDEVAENESGLLTRIRDLTVELDRLKNPEEMSLSDRSDFCTATTPHVGRGRGAVAEGVISQERARGYRHGVGIATSSLTALYLDPEQPLRLRIHAVTVLQEMRAAVGGDLGHPDWEASFLESAATAVLVEREFAAHLPAERQEEGRRADA